MPIVDSFEVAILALKAIIDDEFEDEGFKAVPDDLHESLGNDRVSIGISPIRRAQMPNNASVDQYFIKVQFYGLWEKQVDPTLAVNPITVTNRAARLEHAIATADGSTITTPDERNAVWYFDVTETNYPRDPTANKTRFEMTVRATGDTQGLRETLA